MYLIIFAEGARTMALSGTYITYIYNIHIVYIYILCIHIYTAALSSTTIIRAYI